MSFLNPGPAIATDPAKKLSVLVSGKLSGDLPRPLPSRLLRLNTGQRFGFVIEMECFAEGDAQLGAAMAAKCKAITEAEKPYALTEVGRLLAHQNKAEEAEAAYLRASALDKGYPAAFVCIADLRGVDKKVEGVLSEGEAYAEAAFRMPYNYGFVLRAYVPKGKHLTPEEQRLWTMNRLMAIENTLFYPDYYLWVARDFDGVKAYAQECAMYRQALWAVGRAPYAEKSKETLRKSFAQKIEELEKKVLERAAAPTTPEPPRPTAPTGSPEQLRLALYDRLARLESHALEPEAYAPLVAEFEGLKMYVEACALCRQAIWAVGHTPDPAKYKALSERFQQKIAEFEKHLSEDVSADLPDPIPVRPEKDAPPAAGNAAQTR
jgi:hypothetical protein